MSVTHKVICLWEVLSGVVSHLQGFIVTDEGIPVVAEIELFVVTTCEQESGAGQKHTQRQ